MYVYVTAVFLFVIHECSDGAVGVGVRDRVIERRLGGVEQEFAVRVHDRDVGAGPAGGEDGGISLFVEHESADRTFGVVTPVVRTVGRCSRNLLQIERGCAVPAFPGQYVVTAGHGIPHEPGARNLSRAGRNHLAPRAVVRGLSGKQVVVVATHAVGETPAETRASGYACAQCRNERFAFDEVAAHGEERCDGAVRRTEDRFGGLVASVLPAGVRNRSRSTRAVSGQ